MEKSNIFQKIPEILTEEIFEDIIKADKFKIERIISFGHSSPQVGWYQSELSEWVMVLEGEAILTFETSEEKKLQKGDYINILPFVKHKVSWTLPNSKTIWLAIHYL